MLRYFATLCMIVFCLGSSAVAFDLQGHRGARGLMPENSLPAFAKALSIGVSTLEMDLGITADGQVVVTHDAALNPDIARTAGGDWVAPDQLIRNLSLQSVQSHDVGQLKPGSRAAARFPDQEIVENTTIPTLAQVFELAARAGNETVRFNIETKLNPTRPENTASPEHFVEAVLAVIAAHGLEDRVTIQSFDWRTLQRVQTTAPDIDTVYLSAEQNWLNNVESVDGAASAWTAGFNLEDFDGNVPAMVKAAGGAVWSPFHGDVTEERIRQAQALGLKVIPWTVNDMETMAALMDGGVDGIITDYPDRLRALMQDRNMPLPPATPVSH
jgi:glycerophosphoryl diester phosphodiesterase